MESVNPLMTYSEIRTPFPEATELWTASSAAEWKTKYLSRPRPESESACSLAHSVSAVLGGAPRPLTDDQFSSDICLLYGLWALVWEYKQLQELLSSGNGAHYDGADVLLPSRRESLVKMLNRLKAEMSAVETPSYRLRFPEIAIIFEHLSMVLHLPLQGVQSFAGKEGEREARRIYPVIQEWARTKEARQAIWHAGQVFRAAKQLPRLSMRTYRVILIYHASMAFWAYGIITSVSGKREGTQAPCSLIESGKPIVLLDGDYDNTVRNFILYGDGVPSIHKVEGMTDNDDSKAKLLQNASQTMMVAICLLRKPYEKRNDTCPPMIESITRLMMEIAKAAQSIGLT